MHSSAAMVLDKMPPDLRPIIQPIDTWFENRRLGLLFEAKVNGGSLMVCSMDLKKDLANRPAARQMLHSILQYMKGNSFSPRQRVEPEAIQSLLRQ
jgi:hypothetical protein